MTVSLLTDRFRGHVRLTYSMRYVIFQTIWHRVDERILSKTNIFMNILEDRAAGFVKIDRQW